jgi:hypothetical protein
MNYPGSSHPALCHELAEVNALTAGLVQTEAYKVSAMAMIITPPALIHHPVPSRWYSLVLSAVGGLGVLPAESTDDEKMQQLELLRHGRGKF